MLEEKKESLDEIDKRLSLIEERLVKMGDVVLDVLDDAKKCKVKVVDQDKKIQELIDSHKKMYLYNLEIIKRCPDLQATA